MTTAITEGRWVLRGGVRRLVDFERPLDEPDPEFERVCPDCLADISDTKGDRQRCDTCRTRHARVINAIHMTEVRMARRAANELAIKAGESYVICECGCLLASKDEPCPRCVRMWAREQERAWNRRAA